MVFSPISFPASDHHYLSSLSNTVLRRLILTNLLEVRGSHLEEYIGKLLNSKHLRNFQINYIFHSPFLHRIDFRLIQSNLELIQDYMGHKHTSHKNIPNQPQKPLQYIQPSGLFFYLEVWKYLAISLVYQAIILDQFVHFSFKSPLLILID